MSNNYRSNAKRLEAYLVTETSETTGVLFVSPTGVEFAKIRDVSSETVFQHPWSDAIDIDVDGADELQKRVTVTRMFLLGLFAFALKKKTGEVYAYMSASNGNYLLRIPKRSAPEVRAVIGPFRERIGIQPATNGTVAVGSDSPCPFCGQAVPLTAVKCRACGRFVDGRTDA